MLRLATKLEKVNTLKITRTAILQTAFKSTSPAEEYLNRNTQIQVPRFQQLISKIQIKEGWKCLDIGCGPGNNTYTLSKMVGEKGSVLGIDPDKERLKIAKENFHAPNINYVFGKSVEFPLHDDGYDLVISNLVMHWINYKERIETYQSVSQALKKGGLCAITEIASLPYNVTALIEYMTEKERDFITGNSHFLTIEENKKIFADAALEIIHAEHMITHDSTQSDVNQYLDWFTATYHGNIDARAAYEKSSIEFERNKEGSILLDAGLNIVVARKF